MENIQRKTSEAHTKAIKKYANSKYRPNVFIDMDKRPAIEKHIELLGYKSFNEYITALIEFDMTEHALPQKQ